MNTIKITRKKINTMVEKKLSERGVTRHRIDEHEEHRCFLIEVGREVYKILGYNWPYASVYRDFDGTIIGLWPEIRDEVINRNPDVSPHETEHFTYPLTQSDEDLRFLGWQATRGFEETIFVPVLKEHFI